MILTNCASCAAPLAHDAPGCVRCFTRYCNPTCLHDHWRRGHKHICKYIHRGGGAEQFHAEESYTEAVAVAVEACAEDTKGQTCYICTEALHWKTKEGLVRGCACRGTSGFAHVSCLVEQAKIVVAEAWENNLDNKVKNERWRRWDWCSLCEQNYHGVVRCALGWACWKIYVDRPETDWARRLAMGVLANGLSEAKHLEEALSVQEAQLSMMQRLGDSEHNQLAMQSNLASSYHDVGRIEEAVQMDRDVYYGFMRLFGEEHARTIHGAICYANSLVKLERFEEAKALLNKALPVAQRVLGGNHDLTLMMQLNYARQLYMNTGATLADLREAVTTLEETVRAARRVLGGAHPTTSSVENSLRDARAKLRARGGSFQHASEEKLRTRRIVSVADRFRHPAATRPTPSSDDSRSTSDNQSSARAATDDDAKKRDRAIAEAIPTDADQLFNATVDWAAVERAGVVQAKLRPWVAKRIAEYLGEEEPTLINYVCSCLGRRARPEEIRDELALVLDEDAQTMVVKLWRVLLFHAAKAAQRPSA